MRVKYLAHEIKGWLLIGLELATDRLWARRSTQYPLRNL